MKLSTKLFLFSISIFLTSITIILACGPFGWFDFSYNTLITPEIINNPKAEKFFWSNKYSLYKRFKDNYISDFNAVNVLEWKGYFQNQVSDDKLKFWLYQSTLKEIDEMIFHLQGKSGLSSENNKKFSLSIVSNKKIAIDFLFYLGYAKRNEEFASKQIDLYSWDETEKKKTPTEQIEKQILGGQKFLEKETNPFLIERYIFQIVRLFFLNSQYGEAISFYSKKENLFQTKNSMKPRTLGYIAGSHNKRKEYGIANYLYASLFANEPMMQETAYLSFHPQNGKDWEESLKLAKNKLEKTTLWFLFGVTFDPETAIKEIYTIDAQSEYLEVLLLKEINHVEEHFLMIQPTLPLVETGIKDEHQFNSRKGTFLKTITDIALENKITNKFVWNISAAYLNYAYGDYTQGDKLLEKAKSFSEVNPKTKLQYKSQFAIVHVFGKILSNPKITPEVEKEILPNIKFIFEKQIESIPNFRFEYARYWITNAISVKFATQGEVEKAEVVQHGTVKNHFANMENTKKMITYFDKKDHSELEKFYQSRAGLKKKDYQMLLGIHYALGDELELALETFKSIPNFKYSLKTSPFSIRKKDCHQCDILPKYAKPYSYISFLEKLIELKKETKNNKKQQSENYFLIANAFYNMSYFGTSGFHRNPVHSFQEVFWNWRYRNATKKDYPEMDNSIALKYYLLAAESSKDPEFKAKMNFMAAKSELNEWYLQNKTDDKDFKAGFYFSVLKEKFSETKYYAEIINECTYFVKYLANKK